MPLEKKMVSRMFCWCIFLCALLIGFFFGALFDGQYGPHKITLAVDPGNTEIYVAAMQGDVINWVQFSADGKSSLPVSVGFLTGSPCAETQPNANCTITGTAGGYQYMCVTVYCIDPGLTTQSTTGSSVMRHQSKSSWSREFSVPFLDVKSFFQGLAASGSSDVAGGKPKPDLTAAAALPPITVGVQCYNGAPAVFPPSTTYPPKPVDPIHVAVNQTIVWKFGGLAGSLNNFPANVCSEAPAGGTIGSQCTILSTAPATVPYTIDTGAGGCGSANVSLSVP